MELIQGQFEIVVIVIGAFLGSVKASIQFDKDKHCVYKFLDVLIGMFIGIAVAYHYGSAFSTWIMGLIAVLGGVSGAMVLDVILQVLPTIAKDVILKLVKKFFD